MQFLALFVMLFFMASNSMLAQGQSQTKAIPADPQVPHFITLECTGDGVFQGESKVSVSGSEQVIKIDTAKSVDLPHASVLTLTATPKDGWILSRLTSRTATDITEEKDLVITEASSGSTILPEGCTFSYTLEENMVLRAYFEEKPVVPVDTVKVERGDTLIGGLIPTSMERLEIIGATGSDSTTITLSNVTVGNTFPGTEAVTSVAEGTNAILELKGTVTLDKVLNRGTLVIRNTEDGKAKLTVNAVDNKGIFKDETGLILSVGGDAALALIPLGNSEVKEGESLELRAEVIPGIAYRLTFLWERLVNGTWTKASEPEVKTPEDLRSSLRDATTLSSSLRISSTEAGTYRCTITNEVGEIRTTLQTLARVTVKSDSPTPTPTYHEVTLPVLIGARTTPEGGTHQVKEGDTFSFSIALEPDYIQSIPVVKAGGQTIEPTSSGKYEIKNITADLEITITGIVKNTPTGNAEVAGNITAVWGKDGILHICTPQATKTCIVAFDGRLVQELLLPAGNSTVSVPRGRYIVRIGDETFKIAM